jgi:hypothetical protein
MALNWAKLVAGKKVTNEELVVKEREQRAATEQQQLAKEEVPLRGRYSALRAVEKTTQAVKEQRQAEYLAAHTKEKGYLGKDWSYQPDADAMTKLPDRLHVPRTVNEKAMNWIENVALPSWWEEWTVKCHTIGALKQAFCDAFVSWLWRQERRGYFEFDTYERTLYVKPEHALAMSILARANERERRVALPNAVRYKSMLDWVQLREKEAKSGVEVPYGNQFWVTCKNITFENCLWAMNVASETFRAFDKDNDKELITGFLKVNGNPRLDETTITWLADFSKYVPIQHLPKEKCAQAKAKTKEKTVERNDDDYWFDY